jgi:hypothetical protein
MLEDLQQITGAKSVVRGERIQSLWSGYGELFRARLVGAEFERVVVKHVRPPTAANHPRGWNTSRSHERKLRSYDVETAWYRDFAPKCSADCRVARSLGAHTTNGQWLIVLEDLDAAGYCERHSFMGEQDVQSCLKWLAYFHATFVGQSPEGLWPIGTYWHLATRPDELEALEDSALREAAPKIDARLNACHYQTLVHGDAKVANFCFSPEAFEVAAVDFQYVGAGCGMKDVAYFLGSTLNAAACESDADRYLEDYFRILHIALSELRPEIDARALQDEWRSLYPFAWADFHRFLAGWSPGHWKMNAYGRGLTDQVLTAL